MRGLLVIEPLYHKIVQGLKTQTRRNGGLEAVNKHPDDWYIFDDSWMGGVLFDCNFSEDKISCKPRYKVDEVLYLKEPFVDKAGKWGYGYKFDFPQHSELRDKIKFKNKLFMPGSAARAFIKVTGVRCERLLDISDEDCVAEGIDVGSVSFNGAVTTYINYLMHEGYGYDYIDNTPKESFISLYKLANKLAKVGSVPPHGSLPEPAGIPNIWVWVYEFQYLPNHKQQNN